MARAAEPGRGRNAASRRAFRGAAGRTSCGAPRSEISADRLLLIAGGRRVLRFARDGAGDHRAGVDVRTVRDAGNVGAQLSFLADVMPASAYQLVSDQVVRIAGHSDGKLTFAFIVGLGIALWSANAGMKAIFDALNIVYDEDEKRGFIKLNIVSLSFTFGAIVVRPVAIGAVVVLPLVLGVHRACGRASRPDGSPLLRWPLLFVLVIVRRLRCSIAMGPSRRDAKWRWVRVGSVFAARHLDRGVGRVLLVSLEFRRLQRDLRLARRGDRLDDVDVDFDHRRAGRRRTQFRDRAPDRARFDGRRRQSRSARAAP